MRQVEPDIVPTKHKFIPSSFCQPWYIIVINFQYGLICPIYSLNSTTLSEYHGRKCYCANYPVSVIIMDKNDDVIFVNIWAPSSCWLFKPFLSWKKLLIRSFLGKSCLIRFEVLLRKQATHLLSFRILKHISSFQQAVHVLQRETLEPN